MTAALDDIDTAFEAALAADAGKDAPAEVPPPPRIDPAAPHGRTEDGTPLAPHGLKADGTPRLRAPGPGRGNLKTEDKPRVASSAPAAGKSTAAAGPDYTDDLMGLGTAVWLGASGLKGGRLGPLRLPDARPYAAVWKQQLPAMAAAWNEAAQQNAAVRGYVEKFTGEGSMTWVIGVAVVSAGFVASCAELAKAGPEIRAQAAAANDAAMRAYIGHQVQEMEAAA